jgi:hypothetical protein
LSSSSAAPSKSPLGITNGAVHARHAPPRCRRYLARRNRNVAALVKRPSTASSSNRQQFSVAIKLTWLPAANRISTDPHAATVARSRAARSSGSHPLRSLPPQPRHDPRDSIANILFADLVTLASSFFPPAGRSAQRTSPTANQPVRRTFTSPRDHSINPPAS